MYLNGTLVRELLVYKARKAPHWNHEIRDYKFLFWKRHKEYWYHYIPEWGTYSERELVDKKFEEGYFFAFKEVWEKAHIIFKFSEVDKRTKYFESDEEMEEFLQNFIAKFDTKFIRIK